MIAVGHPAGWAPASVDRYRQTFEKLPEFPEVLVAPEPLAAFIQVCDYHNVSIDSLSNALVVDVGSSTTDFTYVKDMVPEPLPLGKDLGARQIDQILFDLTLSEFANNERFKSTVASVTDRRFLLYLCRRAKEEYFSSGRGGQSPEVTTDRFRAIVDLTWQYLAKIDVENEVGVPRPGLAGGWLGEFRLELKKASEMLGRRRSPGLLVITGGGSRMSFIQQICREVFPTVPLAPDPEPSLSVARGLAGYGRWRMKVDAFREAVKSVGESSELALIVREEADEIGKRLLKVYLDNVLQAVAIPMIEDVEKGKLDPDNFIDFQTEGYARFVSWFNMQGEGLTRAVLGTLRARVEDYVNRQASDVSVRFLKDRDALRVAVPLPNTILFRPRSAFYDVISGLGAAISGPSLRLMKQARWWSGFNKAVLKHSGWYMSATAPLAARTMNLDEGVIATLVADVRREVARKLEAKARKVEALLG